MGLGKSGLATARVLSQSGAQVLAWDDDEGKRRSAGGGFRVGDLTRCDWSKVSCLVWSPGIAHTHPRPHPVAVAARAAGVKIVCDVELLLRAEPNARVIGITGTNGKSTTTALIGHILKRCGIPAAVGGNLGTPVLEFDSQGDRGAYVIELSSYQLELTPSLGANVAVLLNITPDHLSRHGGMDGYMAAKRQIFANPKKPGIAVVGIDDDPCRAIAAEMAKLRERPVIPVSVETNPAGGVFVKDGILFDATGGAAETVMDLQQAPALPGRHNWQNAAAAYVVARACGIERAAAVEAIRDFPGLPHRQELVAVIDGVRYVNDSKATNADAAEKAMACYSAIYWIAGGQAKEGGIASLAPLFPRVRHAFLIGEAAAAFGDTLLGSAPFTQSGNLATAVAEAAAMAARDRLRGAVVLLSPACASWDQFANFEERGDIFRQCVQEIPGHREDAR